jgi:hypothetical protein
MKTIKKAAEEYVGKDIGTILLGYTPVEQAKYDAFKSGIEFAQRWISTNEEVPEIKEESYQILAKHSDGIVNTYWVPKIPPEGYLRDFFSRGEVTHWRPIELK